MRRMTSTLRSAALFGAVLAASCLTLAGPVDADSADTTEAVDVADSTDGLSAQVATPKAVSLEALLEQVRAGWNVENKENKRREAAFRAAKHEQQKLLAQAKATQAREEERSEQYERQFEKNEAHIAELEDLLAQRLGNLGELFGVVRQVAGDTRSHIDDSLISAQLPGRAPFLMGLGQSKALPSLESLEKLWYTLQQEMTEQGKVARFHTTIVSKTGDVVESDVIRVGPFTAVAGGKYLRWNSDVDVQKLIELGGEPANRYQKTVATLEAATEGPVRFAVDPGRGSILAMLVQTPTFEEQIDAGGPIGYAIILLGSVTFLVAVLRLIYIFVVSRSVKSQAKQGQANPRNPLGRILMVYEENKLADTETLELKLDEAILRETARAERFSWLIKVVAAVAPLMGLLGTVTGMIKTFQMITLFGTGDPKMMASGISEALVTTMLGLCVAIPLVLLHSWVSTMSKSIVDVLEEQSAGLVAAQAEGSSEVLNK
jgi:biopolymer transport protein ExbB